MATKIIPAVPGSESASAEVRKSVARAQQQIREVEVKLKRNAESSKRSRASS